MVFFPLPMNRLALARDEIPFTFDHILLESASIFFPIGESQLPLALFGIAAELP